MAYPPLDLARLRAETSWRIEVREETGSTNTDVAAAARADEPEGLVVIAEAQTAGRGRLGRAWVSTPRAGLWLSLLLRPRVDMARWGWLPLLTGVALTDVVPEASLKWPNDLLIGGLKCAGILAETVPGGGVVVGIGLNVCQSREELPDGAISLRLARGRQPDRTQLALELLEALRRRYTDWQEGGGDLPLQYRERCATIGRHVKIALPDDAELTGKATTVDDEGRLVVLTAAGEVCPIAAGDVTHVR